MNINDSNHILTLKDDLSSRDDSEALSLSKSLEIVPVDIDVASWEVIDDLVFPPWVVESELVDVFEKLLLNVVISNERHLESCSCLKHVVENRVRLFQNRVREELLDGPPLSSGEIRRILRDYESRAIKSVVRECRELGVVCSVEKELLFGVLRRFVAKYDFGDPRVFVIVNGLVLSLLDGHRVGFDALREGVMNVGVDRHGNHSWSLNPSLELRRKINDSIASYIEKLDKIIEGSKSVNVNVELSGVKVFKRADMYGYESELNRDASD